jgi:hypothetical protein
MRRDRSAEELGDVWTLGPADLALAAGLPDAGKLGLAAQLAHWRSHGQAVELAVVPQLPLTLTNAVVVTAAVCRDLFPGRAARATVRNLALTSGAANLLLAPFGVMPMCHGAGGVAAQHRFGARTDLAPILLGAALLVLALGFASSAAALFAAIPLSAVGALLLVAGTDLAMSKRLFDARPACWPAIGIAAGATAFVNPAIGLAAGWAVEFVRTVVARAFRFCRAIHRPSVEKRSGVRLEPQRAWSRVTRFYGKMGRP